MKKHLATKKHIIQDSRGFNLIELLIGLSLISILAGLVGTAAIEQRKVQKEATMMALKSEIAEDLRNDLSLFSHCNSLLGASVNATTVADTFDKDIDPTQFNLLFDHPSVTIKSVHLKYSINALKDPQKASTFNNSYQGNLLIQVVPKNNATINTGVYAGLGLFSLPISLFDQAGTKNWGTVSCATQHSIVSSSFGETCALYGGTLTDGTHCDFNRVLRQDYVGEPASSVPIAPADSDNVKHHDLSDLLCYVDTLITMVPDPNFNTPGPRNYNTDSYKRTYNTRFCKRPGRVPASANVSMNNAIKFASADVRDLITSTAVGAGGPCTFSSFDYVHMVPTCVATCLHPSTFIYQDKPLCLDNLP